MHTLNYAASYLTACKNGLKEAQQQFSSVMKGKRIVVFDFGCDVPTNNQKKYYEILKHRGHEALADMLVQTGLGGSIPENASGFFRLLFGEEVQLHHVSCTTDTPIDMHDVALVVFSGSPCMISEVHTETASERDTLLYSQAMNILERVIECQIPLFGVCFGHQIVSEYIGGQITKMPLKKKSWQELIPETHGKNVVEATLEKAYSILPSGYVPVYHSESTSVNTCQSLPVYQSSCDDAIVHAAIHIHPDAGSFVGLAQTDANVLRHAIRSNQFIAVTVQSHPELVAVHPFAEFADTGDDEVFARACEHNLIADDILQLLTDILAMRQKNL